MKSRLLQYLCSPCCGADLQLKPELEEAGEILEGSLLCRACERPYAIRRGVPRFVPDDAYTSSFSFEWDIHRKTQYDTASFSPSRDDFGQKIDMPLEGLEQKLVLDAGCGSGRYIDALRNSGAEIIGVDFSYAIDVSYENLSRDPRVHLVQADLFRLPFRDGLFDYIYSIGVLHHTPDTKRAFLSLVGKLAPGGRISIYVYPSYDWVHRNISAFYRRFTTRLPKRVLYNLCKIAVPLHYVQKIPVIGFLVKLLFPSGACYADPRWRVLNTFDWYSPTYQWTHTIEEVFAWFEAAGLERIRVLPSRVSLAGSRPSGRALSAEPALSALGEAASA
jgi:SAM-dependent methyltransferase